MSSPPPPMIWPGPPPAGGTVIPFPLPWGQTGCCPPGGMDALMKCYCDIQQASAFIGQIMLDQINNNPAITAAIIAAIEASGSSLPTLGVTNGSNAQPGQVGEFFRLQQNVPFTAGAVTNVTISLGVVQPGDWDFWAGLDLGVATGPTSFYLNPEPVGVSNGLHTATGAFVGTDESDYSVINAANCRASFSVPTLIPFLVFIDNSVSGAVSGTATMWLEGRRAR